MYFNEKNNTNIDTEFKNKNGSLLGIKNLFSKFKLFKIIGIILLIVICVFFIFFNKKIVNYLILNGEDIITLYQGTDYIEPGYKAYDSNDKDLTNEVKIESNLNTKEVGSYEITYRLGDIVKVRKITVIEKTVNITFIHLTPVNNDIDVYLNVGEEYKEPGYKVFSSSNEDLTDKVIVSGNVDTSKVGSYRLVYTVTDNNGVTVSKTRIVYVINTDIDVLINTTEWTNGDVSIEIKINDDLFDYMLDPVGIRVDENKYTYKVSSNGEYKFKIYNNKGLLTEKIVDVTNIDKIAPSGSCVINSDTKGIFINVSANDNVGISKYEYNGSIYYSNKIELSSYVDNAKVIIYDKANNKKQISCNSNSKAIIKSITNDGVIVNVVTHNNGGSITGYYFSYSNKIPNKETGGYLSTSNKSVEVVRLPGTTYVWVEYDSGKISSPMSITIGTDLVPVTNNKGKVLIGTQLGTYISNKGDSLDELNKLIVRSVRAAGLYTKEGAATAAVSLQMVLMQRYNLKVPYRMGGKNYVYGASKYWGSYSKNPTYEGYDYLGFDCGGFVNWSYFNTGIEKNSFRNDNFYFWDGIKYSSSNGEVGDVLRRYGTQNVMQHVAIIVGKTDKAFIVAEALGKQEGVAIRHYSYDKPNGYEIIKGERLIEKYNKVSRSDYPSGF